MIKALSMPRSFAEFAFPMQSCWTTRSPRKMRAFGPASSMFAHFQPQHPKMTRRPWSKTCARTIRSFHPTETRSAPQEGHLPGISSVLDSGICRNERSGGLLDVLDLILVACIPGSVMPFAVAVSCSRPWTLGPQLPPPRRKAQ